MSPPAPSFRFSRPSQSNRLTNIVKAVVFLAFTWFAVVAALDAVAVHAVATTTFPPVVPLPPSASGKNATLTADMTALAPVDPPTEQPHPAANASETAASLYIPGTAPTSGTTIVSHGSVTGLQAAVLWSPLVVALVAVLTGGAVSAEVLDAHRAAATLALSAARTVAISPAGGAVAALALFPVDVATTRDLRILAVSFGVVLPIVCLLGSVAILSWRVARRATAIVAATANAGIGAPTGQQHPMSPIAARTRASASPPRAPSARALLSSPLLSLVSWINAAIMARSTAASGDAPAPPQSVPPAAVAAPFTITIAIPSAPPPPPPPRQVLTVRAVAALACTSASFACYSVIASAVFLLSLPQPAAGDVVCGVAALVVTCGVYASLARACWEASHRNRAVGSPLGSGSVVSWSDSVGRSLTAAIASLCRPLSSCVCGCATVPHGPQHRGDGDRTHGRVVLAVPSLPGDQPGPPVGGGGLDATALCSDMRAFRLRIFRWDDSERRGGSGWDGPRAAFYFTSTLSALGAAALAGAAQSATQRELATAGRLATATFNHRCHAVGILLCHAAQLGAVIMLRPFRSRRQTVFAVLSAAAALAGAIAAVVFAATDDPRAASSWRHSDAPALIAAIPAWVFTAYALLACVWYQFVTRTRAGVRLVSQWRIASEAVMRDAVTGSRVTTDGAVATATTLTAQRPSTFAILRKMLSVGVDAAQPMTESSTVVLFGAPTPSVVFQEEAHTFETERDAYAAAERLLMLQSSRVSDTKPSDAKSPTARPNHANNAIQPAIRWSPDVSINPSAPRARPFAAAAGKDTPGGRAFCVLNETAATAGIERDLAGFDSLSSVPRHARSGAPLAPANLTLPVRWPVQRGEMPPGVASPWLVVTNDPDGGGVSPCAPPVVPPIRRHLAPRPDTGDVSSASSGDSSPVLSAARGACLDSSAPRARLADHGACEGAISPPRGSFPVSAARSHHCSSIRRRGGPPMGPTSGGAALSASRGGRGLLLTSGVPEGVANPLTELPPLTALPIGAATTPQHGSLRLSSASLPRHRQPVEPPSGAVPPRAGPDVSGAPDASENFYYDPLKAQMREVLGGNAGRSIALAQQRSVSPIGGIVQLSPSQPGSSQRRAREHPSASTVGRTPSLPIMDGFVDDFAESGRL